MKILLLALLFAMPAWAGDPGPKPEWFDRATRDFAVSCEPAEAKPGQTVTLKIRLDLAEGYTVYPLKQTDPAAESMVSKITFPKDGSAIFVGDVTDPAGAKTKTELELGITGLKYYTDKVTWERKFVVDPAQKPGELIVTLPSLKFAICGKQSCFPPKGFAAETKLKVLGGPPVPVEAKYIAEVAKARK